MPGRMKSILAVLLLAGGVLSGALAAVSPEATCSSGTTIFCSGFEEGSFSIWNDYDGNPAPTNSLLSDAGPLNLTGNSIARLFVPAGRGTADLTKLLPSTYDKVYVRWYQKWEQGYDFGAANHGSGIHAGSRELLARSDYRPTGSDWFSAFFEPLNGRMNLYVYYRGMYQDCSNANGSCWGDRFPCILDDGSNYCTKAEHREKLMPPLMQTGKWYCFEIMVDAGNPVASDASANGAVDYWIDNTEYGPWGNLWFRTTQNLKTSILWMSLFHHGDHAAAGVLLDNVVVSSQRVGCAGGAGATPSAPTNLRAS